jgi:RluA family pseudouridine synthase
VRISGTDLGGTDRDLVRLSCRVDRSRSGRTLAEFLALRFRYLSPDTWRDRIEGGSVTLNGVPAEGESLVQTGDEITYAFVHVEPTVDFRYDVLYESEALLGVGKSGNLPVHAAGVFIRHTLMATLAERYGRSLFLVNRLDRETSGVVIVARHSDVARVLEAGTRGGAVTKVYLALLHGTLDTERACSGPIGRDPSSRAPRFRVAEDGKPAVTRFEPLASRASSVPALRGEPVSLVRVRPETGRTHQIRVHARAIGHPIVGDKVYGTSAAGGGARADEDVRFRLSAEEARLALGAPRHLLHCSAIELPLPGTTQRLRVCAPLPEDFLEAWPGAIP